MRNFTFLVLLIFMFGCLPAAQPPAIAPPDFFIQQFAPTCQKGAWNGTSIVYEIIPEIAEDACVTYTLVHFTQPDSTIARISGRNVEINQECVTIDSIVTDDNIYERLRCEFPVTSDTLNVFLAGEELTIVVEIAVDDTIYYLPPLGVEGEEPE